MRMTSTEGTGLWIPGLTAILGLFIMTTGMQSSGLLLFGFITLIVGLAQLVVRLRIQH